MLNNVLFTHKFFSIQASVRQAHKKCSKCGNTDTLLKKIRTVGRYDWSATGQLQTAFCVCQRENWECRRPCAQSGRQSINAPIESWDLVWNWHSLTDCTQNNLLRSPAQLCQTTSRTAVIWNQSRCPSDSLQAAVVAPTVWLHMV